MWQNFIDILTVTPFSELFLIFIAKIIEVSFGTMRIILISKGYRKLGTIFSIIEIFLWVFVASTVINGIGESPMKGVAYGLGFSAGVYIGSLIEQKLAFGKVLIQSITTKEIEPAISSALRSSGYGVTVLDGSGKDDKKAVIMIYTNRRGSKDVVDIIVKLHPQAMVVSNDVNNVSGGYINPLRKLFK